MTYKYYENIVKDVNDYQGNNWKYRQLSDFIKVSGYRSRAKVGNISYLIQKEQFENVSEFQEYYYKNGEESLKSRQEMFFGNSDYKTKTEYVEKYGRTRNELRKYLDKMYEILTKDLEIFSIKTKVSDKFNLLNNGNKCLVTFDELKAHYLMLIFGHSWNGIIVRESNVKYNLKKEFPNLDYKDDYSLDAKYGIDILVYNGEKHIFNLQIKPTKYLEWNMKQSEKYKHKEYEQLTGIKTYYLYADDLGNYDNSFANVLALNNLKKEN